MTPKSEPHKVEADMAKEAALGTMWRKSRQVRRHYAGCYRWTMNADVFGQVKKVGRRWAAEVRLTETGAIVRYAGLWPTLRGAVEELVAIGGNLR